MQLFVVGAGYVGLTTAIGFNQLGHDVTVHDVSPERLAQLSAGHSPLLEDGLEEALQQGLAAERLRFTASEVPPGDTALAFVCVPTPLGPDGLLDTALVEDVVKGLLDVLPTTATIVVRSTLPLHGPGRLRAVADADHRPAVLVNPEFMREGHALADFWAPSRVAVGYLEARDRAAAEAFAGLYEPLRSRTLVADAESIVLVKLASNVFLATKVAFANELARLADAIGADASVVVDGLGLDPRIGRAFLDSGPGIGGSCLPEQAEAIAVETSRRHLGAVLMEAVAASNRHHQEALVEAVGQALPNGLPGARVALLGLAFKANTNDVRRSPGLAIGQLLRDRGAGVVAYDPVASAPARQADPQLLIADSPEAAAAGADAVVIATEWPAFAELDWPLIARAMRGGLVFDTRRIASADEVEGAGLRYLALGRPARSARPLSVRQA
jgi:UDPglucose 6-dehydrogenase